MSTRSERRRTKIVATLGPASDSSEQIRDLIDEGVDVFRLSLAHDPVDVVLDRIKRIRRVADGVGSAVAVLADLPGPKVRAGSFGEDGVEVCPAPGCKTYATKTLRSWGRPKPRMSLGALVT